LSPFHNDIYISSYHLFVSCTVVRALYLHFTLTCKIDIINVLCSGDTGSVKLVSLTVKWDDAFDLLKSQVTSYSMVVHSFIARQLFEVQEYQPSSSIVCIVIYREVSTRTWIGSLLQQKKFTLNLLPPMVL